MWLGLFSGHPTGFWRPNTVLQPGFTAAAVSGLSLQVTGDHVVYENELVASRDVKTGSLGSVTRDSTFR